MTTAIAVAVAPGSGRIARRSQVLLFDPTGDNAELIASFDAAADDASAITAVKQHLIDADFQVSPVVVIDWRVEGLGLIVFGDADVHSSATAAPMISGAGSGTWIERHLGALELGDSVEAHVWCGDETDPATDLRLGIVRGGGVRVSVSPSSTPPQPAEIPPPAPEAENPRPVPAPAPAPVAASAHAGSPIATNGSAPVAPAPAPVVAAAPVAPAPVVAGAPVAPAVAPAPIAEAGYVAGPEELEWTDTEPKPPAGDVVVAEAVDPFVEPAAPAGVPATTEFEDSVTEPAGAVKGLDEVVEAAVAGLVEASMCSNGHNNPPRCSICRTCAVEIDPDADISLIAQPSVGDLRFADGNVVEINKTLVIGRKPAADPPVTHPVLVDHAEVSRSHVQVSLEGWAVLATDLGSRNGTWVIPPSDPTPVKLDANVPYLLEHGTTVHLGGPEASFTYDFGTD